MNDLQSNNKHILIVDDDPLVRRSLSEFLTIEGFTVSSAGSAREAIVLLKDYTADIVITDIKMPEVDGIQFMKQLKNLNPETPVILMTGYGSIDSAVEAMKEGAYDYITKPIIDNEIKLIIERCGKQQQMQEENVKLKKELSIVQRDHFYNIIGKSPEMQKIYSLIEAVLNTRATVLINGESGTGKRLIAHAIHKYNEHERGKPFVEVSCGALTETLLESELFGHVKGAFTGAIKDKIGRFELADGGSIFLDEIDAFSPALQVKLLRVLQDGEFEMVGDNQTKKIDVRVIAATNQNLQELIVQGKFRKDLFYRLNIISLEIPPLRKRKEDIPILVEHFIKKHAKHLSKKVENISAEALSILVNYSWPGNVRELENVIERAAILSKSSIITPDDFPEFLSSLSAREQRAAEPRLKLKHALQSPEKELIIKALERTDWNRSEAAQVLGINRTTLYKKMSKFGLLKNKRQAA